MLLLGIPDLDDKNEVMAFRDEFLAEDTMCFVGSGKPHVAGAPSLATSTYEEWLAAIRNDMTNPGKGRVIATQYIAKDESGKVVGMIQLRHALTEQLLQGGGHIGYSVRPSERRKGYATSMLKQCIEIAQDLGLKRILITCTDGNIGSEKTILKAGGVYENTVTLQSGTKKKRFWIDIA